MQISRNPVVNNTIDSVPPVLANFLRIASKSGITVFLRTTTRQAWLKYEVELKDEIQDRSDNFQSYFCV